MEEKNLIYLSSDDDLKTVLACFKFNKISHVPVTIEKKIVGMISKTDVVEFLHDHQNEYSTDSLEHMLSSVQAKELMIQPLIEAQETDTEMDLLEKLLLKEVSSVVIRNDQGQLTGIVTEKDMLKYLTGRLEDKLSFSEKLSLHIVRWLDNHGLIRLSRMLGDIGI